MRGSNDKYCKNTAIQRACFPTTEVFQTGEYGHGLFTLQDLPPDTIIVEYCGEVISEKECLRRMSDYKSTEHFYFASLQSGLVLDAAVYGSTARFANHSCEPNCTLQKWTVNGEPRVVLVSTTFIKSGSELTYNYQYFQDGLDDIVGKFKRQTCACGSRVCCGTIGGRVTAVNPLREREKWISKARAVLDVIDLDQTPGVGGSKRCGVDVLQELLDQASDIDTALVCQPTTTGSLNPAECVRDSLCRTQEYTEVAAAVSISRDWQQRVEMALQSLSLITPSTFDELVGSLPYRLRVDVALHSKIDSIRRAVKSCETLCRGVSNPHTSPPQQAAEGEARMQWSVFAKIVQCMADAAPVICCSEWAMVILRAYQEYTKWANDLFSVVAARTDSYAMSQDQKRLCPLWSMVHRLGVCYDVKVSPLVFHLEDCVRGRLEAFRFRENQKGVAADQRRIKLESLERDEGAGAAKLDLQDFKHCFCGLPDDISELKTFVQCDVCDEWYHVECANIPAPSADSAKSLPGAGKRRSAALQKSFACPLCQQRAVPPTANNFLVVQPYEWHKGVGKQAMSRAHLMRGAGRAGELYLIEVGLCRDHHTSRC
jgi:hypothetical protein